MEDVLIREAKQEDLVRCEELFNSKEFKTADGLNWKVSWLEQYLDKNFFLVSIYEGKLVGCILGEKLKQNGSVIWLLVVDSNYRNLGIGSRLINRYEENAKSAGCEWTVVYADLHSPKTLDFYKKNNYVVGDNYIECLKNF